MIQSTIFNFQGLKMLQTLAQAAIIDKPTYSFFLGNGVHLVDVIGTISLPPMGDEFQLQCDTNDGQGDIPRTFKMGTSSHSITTKKFKVNDEIVNVSCQVINVTVFNPYRRR